MLFERGVYVIEHDPERTKDFYARAADTLCDCAGCRNFRASVSRMPEELRDFLEQFGIDPAKPAEMSAVHAPDPGRIFYDGFYHLCGELLEGPEPFIQTGPKNFRLDQNYLLPVGEGSVWFGAKCALVDPDFPRPVLQLELSFYQPWVLEEENPYL